MTSDERVRVLALLGERVAIRFALDAQGFADHLLALPRAVGSRPGEPPYERLSRLGLDDLYLATSCLREDAQAWREFAQRYFGFIRDFAGRYLPASQALDLGDHVIADLWQSRKLARYQGRSRLRTWLGAVVIHAALNRRKAFRRQVLLQAELRTSRDLGAQPALATGDGSLLGRMVREAIDDLPPEEKLLLLLHYERGLTLDDLGLVWRLSKATLSRRLKRTRQQLLAGIELRAHRRLGASAEALRAGINLAHVDLDLSAVVILPDDVPGAPSSSRMS